jgi:DNA-binding PadR family transcriptional regulator
MLYNGIVVITNPSARERFLASENHEPALSTEFLITSRGLRTRVLLTAAERVLLHLLPLWNAKDAVHEATQEGISEGTGLRRSHVPRALKRLVADNSVDVRDGRLRGRGRKVRVYSLTEAGIRRARDLLGGLSSEPVRFGDRRIALAVLAEELHVSPAEIVAGVDDEGVYRPRQVAIAVPQTDLIERDSDLRALVEWVKSPAPVAVVYGSRGMGKTALARAFHSGIRRPSAWVDVVPDDAEALRTHVAASLRVAGGSGTPEGIDRDIAALKPLVVLDGYGEVSEDVVDTVRSLFAAVGASPGAKLLVLAQEATPSYCRFYGAAEVRRGAVREVRLKGLSPEGTKSLLGNPAIGAEALRQVYLLTKGCPLYLTLIRDGNAAKLREVSRFTPAEIRLLLFSRAPTR